MKLKESSGGLGWGMARNQRWFMGRASREESWASASRIIMHFCYGKEGERAMSVNMDPNL